MIEVSLEAARHVYRYLIEQLDEYLKGIRDKRLRVEHKRGRWVNVPPLGNIRIKRRQYKDENGKYEYLVDRLLGLEKKSPLTPELTDMATFLATLLPFRKSSEVIDKSLSDASVSHTTIHRLVGKVADSHLREEDLERRQLFETGEMPVGEGKVVPRLFVEGDGTMISLQREKERRVEVKAAIAYEGWEKVGKGRYKLKDKIAYSGVMSGSNLWEGLSLKMARKYDLSGIEKVIIGGDGASWVKGGATLLGGTFQLDRFHLRESLYRSLGYQRNFISPIYRACDRGDWLEARALLKAASIEARGKEKENIGRLIKYLGNNCDGLRDYRLDLGEEGKGLRRTGAMESNIDKLVANRMKKRGMSWTIAGANRMSCLLVLSMEGKLSRTIERVNDFGKQAKVSIKKVRRILKKSFEEAEGKWLQAGIPAVYGPHQSRPWVKYLRSLSEASRHV